jgi:hypothetical protein
VKKRSSARIGALTCIVLFVVLLAVTTTMGWCDGERFERRSVIGSFTEPRYARTKLTICGFVRGVAGQTVSSVPCQVWNLAPFALLAGFSAWWLVRDLTGLRRYEEKPKRRKRR